MKFFSISKWIWHCTRKKCHLNINTEIFAWRYMGILSFFVCWGWGGVQVRLRQKYRTPQVQAYWGSNPQTPDHGQYTLCPWDVISEPSETYSVDWLFDNVSGDLRNSSSLSDSPRPDGDLQSCSNTFSLPVPHSLLQDPEHPNGQPHQWATTQGTVTFRACLAHSKHHRCARNFYPEVHKDFRNIFICIDLQTVSWRSYTLIKWQEPKLIELHWCTELFHEDFSSFLRPHSGYWEWKCAAFTVIS